MSEKQPLESKEYSNEHAESLMKQQIDGKLKEKKPPLYTSFGLLIDSSGQPILAERRTKPHEGLFSLFMLNRLSFKSELPQTLKFGSINHIALPSDCLVRSVNINRDNDNEKLKLSKELHEPAYLVQY